LTGENAAYPVGEEGRPTNRDLDDLEGAHSFDVEPALINAHKHATRQKRGGELISQCSVLFDPFVSNDRLDRAAKAGIGGLPSCLDQRNE
jgi:hypothetical protein